MAVVAASSFFFGALIAYKSLNKKARLPSLLFLSTLGIWALGRLFMAVAATKPQAYLALQLSYLGSAWMPTLCYVFYWRIINRPLFKPLLGIFSLFSLLVMGFIFGDLLISDLTQKLTFQFYESPLHPYFDIFSWFYTGTLIYVHAIVIKEFRKSTDTKRTQLAYLLLASGLGFSASFTTFPLVNDVQLYPFGVPIMALYPLIAGYALTKYELVDLKIAVTRAMAYIILIGSIIFTFSGVNFVLDNLSLITISANVTLGILWSLSFKKLLLIVQTPLQKKFLKGYYNTEEILHTLSTQLLYTHDYASVMSVIATEFLNQLELKSAYTFFLTDNNEFEVKKVGIAPPLGTLSTQSEFIEFFNTQATPIPIEELPEPIQIELDRYNFEKHSLLFAVHSSKQLKGIFLLSPKLNEDAFGKSDMQLLSTITNQILVVFDRIAKEKELAVAVSQLKNLNDNLEIQVAEQVKEIEEKQKMEKELKLAGEIQRRALPTKVPKITNYTFDAKFFPSRTVSGDYYDFLIFSEKKIGIIIADIIGKGIPAAFLMMNLKTLFHQVVREKHTPKEAMQALNTAFIDDDILEKYSPLIYGTINTEDNTFTYCNAGHEPGFHISNNTITELDSDDGPVGCDKADIFTEKTIQLSDNDILLLCTDGITDVENTEGEKLGIERVHKLIKQYPKSKDTYPSLCNMLSEEITNFRNPNIQLKDDTTLISIEFEQIPFFKQQED